MTSNAPITLLMVPNVLVTVILCVILTVCVQALRILHHITKEDKECH